jgi:hypothetical protein
VQVSSRAGRSPARPLAFYGLFYAQTSEEAQLDDAGFASVDFRQSTERIARGQGIDGAKIHRRFLEITYIEGNQAAAAREIQWFAGRPVEYLSFGSQAANQNALGKRRESSKLYQRAAETALRLGLRNAAAESEEAECAAG